MMVSRRRLLVGAAALGLWPRRLFAAAADQADALLALLPDRAAAAALGSAWVQQEHRQPGEILQGLQQSLNWSADADAATLRNAMAAAVAEDYRNGAIVKLEGWQVARTQAELCALAYFATVGSL